MNNIIPADFESSEQEEFFTPFISDAYGPMNPFADPVLEAIFLNKDVAGLAARSLINAVLADNGEPQIGEITDLTPQKTMPNFLGRGYRFDIEARVSQDELTNIEVQFRPMLMNERAFLHAGRLMVDTIKRGGRIQDITSALPRVIIINILLFNLRKNHSDFHQPVALMYQKPTEDGKYEVASDRVIIHNIEVNKFIEHQMPKMLEKPYNQNTSALQYWLWALCVAYTKKKSLSEVVEMNAALKEFARQDAGFKQYTDRFEDISDDEKVRLLYAIWTEGTASIEYQQFRAERAERHLEEADRRSEEYRCQKEEADRQREEADRQREEADRQREEAERLLANAIKAFRNLSVPIPDIAKTLQRSVDEVLELSNKYSD